MTLSRLQNALSIRAIGGLFHFTDTRNLPSIRTHGLLSLRQLRAKQIAATFGGNDWSHDADQRVGIDDDVHLSLSTSHPMEFIARESGRISEAKYLMIDPQILATPGVRFSVEVANKSGAEVLPIEHAFDALDLEVLLSKTEWSDPIIKARLKAARKSEILVPREVAVRYITF